ncbi:MAG: class I SAM-dependent methyltransferase [Desulfatiglandaceae bacterium]|jgi:ubiquinone/menaquinone biosynthesis C-methylase UbiE
MALIFNRNSARAYDAWYKSRQGQSFDRTLEAVFCSFLDPCPGDRALDIGCGSGNHLLALNRLGLDITGLDASSSMIRRARERLGGRCTLKIGRAEDLPFEDNAVDFALLIHTLEFLDDPLPALREAGRVARKKVFVGIMNTLSCDGILRKFKGYFGNPLFRHAHFFNLWQIKSVLKMAYGPVPLSWQCVPPFFSKPPAPGHDNTGSWIDKRLPFASCLCFSATLTYTTKTQNLPLKMRLKGANRGVIGAKALQDLKHVNGGNQHERGLSL